MRVLFMGTPDYAVDVLRKLRTVVDDCDIRVVSQPDKQKGRHYRIQASALSEYALQEGLRLDRPHRLRDLATEWRQFAPDVGITAAYGRILPAWLLALPRRSVNLHASLLPRWRGPNPIAWAIYQGDVSTGVSLMEMALGVDEGPVLAKREVEVGQETFTRLSQRLGHVAGDLLTEVWPELLSLPSHAQPEEGVTYAPKFSKEMQRVDWHRSAQAEARRIRSMSDTPGAYTMWGSQRIRLAPPGIEPGNVEPGRIISQGDAWMVGCGQDMLVLTSIQPQGKSWMTPGAFCRGLRGETPKWLT